MGKNLQKRKPAAPTDLKTLLQKFDFKTIMMIVCVVGLFGTISIFGQIFSGQAPKPVAPVTLPESSEASSLQIPYDPTAQASVPVVPLPGEKGQEGSKIPSYVGPLEGGISGTESGAAVVEEVSSLNVPAMDRTVGITREVFDAQSDEYNEDNLLGDKFLSYRLRLPKGWKRTKDTELKEVQLSDRLPGVLAYYVGPSSLDKRSSFRIKAQRLAHLVSPEQWLYQYAFANRYTLNGLSSYGRYRAEGMYVINELDASYLARVVVIFNGSRVLLGEYLVPIEDADAEKDMQTWSVVSFQLKHIDNSPSEPIEYYNFLDIGAFRYPKSWKLQDSPFVSIDQMDTSILNVRNDKVGIETILQGRIDVYFIAQTDVFTLDRAFEEVSKKVGRGSPLVIGDVLGDFKPFENEQKIPEVLSRKFSITSANNTYQDYEYWVTALKGQNYHIFVCLLTPPQTFDFYNWSRNLSAYQFIVGSIREGT